MPYKRLRRSRASISDVIQGLENTLEERKALVQVLSTSNQQHRFEHSCIAACLEGIESLRLQRASSNKPGSINSHLEHAVSGADGGDVPPQSLEEAELLEELARIPWPQPAVQARGDDFKDAYHVITRSYEEDGAPDSGACHSTAGSDSHATRLASSSNPMSYFHDLLQGPPVSEGASITLEELARRYANAVGEMAVQLHLLDMYQPPSKDYCCATPSDVLKGLVDRCG